VLGMKSRGIQRVRLDVVKDPETVAFLHPLARPE
jgi:hypothetical protein